MILQNNRIGQSLQQNSVALARHKNCYRNSINSWLAAEHQAVQRQETTKKQQLDGKGRSRQKTLRILPANPVGLNRLWQKKGLYCMAAAAFWYCSQCSRELMADIGSAPPKGLRDKSGKVGLASALKFQRTKTTSCQILSGSTDTRYRTSIPKTTISLKKYVTQTSERLPKSKDYMNIQYIRFELHFTADLIYNLSGKC